jgi:hypothetical protein
MVGARPDENLHFVVQGIGPGTIVLCDKQAGKILQQVEVATLGEMHEGHLIGWPAIWMRLG